MELVQNSFAQLEISTSNVLHNYNYFRGKLHKSTKLLVLVKANSYGHGALEFANLLEKAGVDYFGIALPVEGIELREGGITKPILALTIGTDSFKDLVDYNLEPSIPNITTLTAFEKYLEQRNINSFPIHIKLDTGMHRLGFMSNELDELLKFFSTKRRVCVKSIFSHLAAADDPMYDDFTLGQIKMFQENYAKLDKVLGYTPLHHILNSSGIERFNDYQMDMVRLGLGIYGLSAVNQANLKPASSLKCDILQIKTLRPEDGTIGYGRAGKITKPVTIATLPLGYADGINRKFGNGRAKFFLNGKLVPTIGNICMDMFMIDITGVDAKVGDTVTIYGENPTASDLAEILETIPYEVLTSLDRRVKRAVVK